MRINRSPSSSPYQSERLSELVSSSLLFTNNLETFVVESTVLQLCPDEISFNAFLRIVSISCVVETPEEPTVLL